MTQYVRIIDGIVQSPQLLPENFRTKDGTWITGFHHMAEDQLVEHGFFKIVIPDVKYDPETQDVSYFENVLNDDGKTVSPKYEITDKMSSSPAGYVSDRILPILEASPDIMVDPIQDDFTLVSPEQIQITITAQTADPNSPTPQTQAEEI